MSRVLDATLTLGLLTAVARRFAAASAVPRARGEHVARLLALTALPVKSGLSTHHHTVARFQHASAARLGMYK